MQIKKNIYSKEKVLIEYGSIGQMFKYITNKTLVAYYIYYFTS
jgi:hypothetical protein